MRIAVDIDGVLTLETEGHDYTNRTPNKENIEKVNELDAAGHTIILHTARWEQDRGVTKAWLDAHGLVACELLMGKVLCDLYIDDKASTTIPTPHDLYMAQEVFS